SSVSLFDSSTVASVSALGNDFSFHGLQHDEVTGFVYARNRSLDPETGRFVSVDPYGYVDGPSTYQYALNNPASFLDPTDEIAVVDNIVGGAVSVAVGAGLTCLTVGCGSYSQRDAAIDFGLGFATSGLSSLGNMRHLASGTAGTARFGSRVAGEGGLDVGAEYLRHKIAHPGEEIGFGRLAVGSFFNYGIGEAGGYAFRSLRTARNLETSRPHAPSADGARSVAADGTLQRILRARHHTDPGSARGIRRDMAINPGRGDPHIGVHVEVEPFGRTRTGIGGPADDLGSLEGAYVEFDLPEGAIPTPHVGPRNTVVVPTKVPLALQDLNPVFKTRVWPWEY
ncbi:MAG: RHS repeat-associated core domain-containing protein, partial [Acidobacteriota bacterium]